MSNWSDLTIEEIEQNPALMGFLCAFVDIVKRLHKEGKLEQVLAMGPEYRYDPYKAYEEKEELIKAQLKERWKK